MRREALLYGKNSIGDVMPSVKRKRSTTRTNGGTVVAWARPTRGLSGYTQPMTMSGFPFSATDWTQVIPTEHPGETGTALWRTQTFADIRVRIVEYSPGYLADHWCSKGHILLCLEGELETELADGKSVILRPGQSYQVADGESSHRSATKTGAKLFIVD